MISIQIKEAQKVNGDLSAFISFPYDAELVGLMRNQSSRFWHAANKEWEVPANKLLQIINSVKDLYNSAVFGGNVKKVTIEMN